jgi:hypothetical protein
MPKLDINRRATASSAQEALVGAGADFNVRLSPPPELLQKIEIDLPFERYD